MRILYDNLIDGLAASRITALTEEALYEASRVQDQRLTTQWQTTSPTAQTIIFAGSSETIVGGNIGLVTGSAATNLVTDPENMTSGNWSAVRAAVTTAESIIGVPAYEITANETGSGYILGAADIGITLTSSTIMMTMKKGNDEGGHFLILDIDDGSAVRSSVQVTFSTKGVSYIQGSEAMPPRWVDDDTVKIFANPTSGLVPGNDNRLYMHSRIGAGSGITADSCIFSAPMALDNSYPVPYVATSRSSISTSYTQRLPPSGKFIIDCEFSPFFNYDTGSNQYVWVWYADSSSYFQVYYRAASDVFRFGWIDNGTYRELSSAQYGGAFRELNTRIRITGSFNFENGDINGSMLFMNGTLDDSTWDGAPDSISSSTFTTLQLAHYSTSRTDSIFRNFRIYGGVFTSAQSAITTEAEIDTALEDHTLLFDQTYQRQFDMDTVAIMGHNISEGAAVKMEANDWDEWNYVDGSGSSIIQHSLTWDDETILKMITATKKQYVKFTIDDPNNDDAKLKIGRFWLGRYLDIDPASLDAFTVKKRRTDDVSMGVNRQKFASLGTGFREFNLKFPPTNSTMVTAIQTMYDHVGNHSSVIFCNFNTLRDYEIVEPVYCSIVGDVSFSHQGRQKYTYGLKLEENK